MKKHNVVILVEQDYQDMEVWVPLYRLREEGYETVIAAPRAGIYKSKHGYPIEAAVTASELKIDDCVGVVRPGGWAPDRLRQDAGVLALVKGLNERKRIVAAICHAGWVLASAG